MSVATTLRNPENEAIGRPAKLPRAPSQQAGARESHATIGQTSTQPTIFHEDWWLDIATEGRWSSAKLHENGRLLGWMPYFIKKQGAFHKSVMPPFTHFLGPAVNITSVTAAKSFAAEIDIVTRLLELLPAVSSFRQKFHRAVEHVVPFQMQGYRTSIQFTFELPPSSSEAIWQRIKSKQRNCIRSAEKEFTADDSMSSAEFGAFYVDNLRQKGRSPADDMNIALGLIDASRARDRGYILVARDRSGRAKAAIFCVCDSQSSYYLMASRTADSGNGAVALLIWRAIERAGREGRVFDFDGLGHQSSIPFYSSFGGACRPRYTAQKTSRAFEALQFARHMLDRNRNSFVDNN